MIYIFTISMTVNGVGPETEGLEDAFFEGGCNDALISFKDGELSLRFDRESESLQEALESASRDVCTALTMLGIIVYPE